MRFTLRASSLPLPLFLRLLLLFILFNKYQYWHSYFLKLWQFYPKGARMVSATRFKGMLTINFPCNFCHLCSSDFRLNWFVSKSCTQWWPPWWSHLWSTYLQPDTSGADTRGRASKCDQIFQWWQESKFHKSVLLCLQINPFFTLNPFEQVLFVIRTPNL